MRRKISTLGMVLGVAVPLLFGCYIARAPTARPPRDDAGRRSDKPFTWSGTVRSRALGVRAQPQRARPRRDRARATRSKCAPKSGGATATREDVKITVRQVGSSGGDVIVCALWNDRSSCDEDGYHSHNDGWNWFSNNQNDVQV